ncbi:chemokine-like factor isoform X2 [Pipistrellus kuhlii]|uniref:chemokine-like factor isoform X2 n=1 Tax=Pipistrellus kuhlii TaxID=59472 RepID=UPI001E27206E|nr:chemokine-like factor isoform X2 [Pipistrellus kuhlii]
MNPKQRPFCCSVKGNVKLVLTATSMTFFILSQDPEPYIVITGFEVTITFAFIVLYMIRLDRRVTFLCWPLLDIINSLVAAMFMMVIAMLALIAENMLFTVLGGVFCLLAVVCCFADAALIYRKLLFNPSGPYQKKAIHDEI